MSEREKFEAAWRKEYPLHGATTFKRSGFNPDAYVNTRVQDGWLMWQARAATSAQAIWQADSSLVKLFDALMQQNIVTSDESYLALKCVGVPPTETEFVRAVQRTIAATPPSPDAREAVGGALTDTELKDLVRKVEDKLGIVWFVPDDSERHLWRTTTTDERDKFVRAILREAGK